MLASVATFALEGVSSREVTVEVDARRGLPAFTVVGLPDRAVRESRERIRAAIANSGLEFPLKRLTANLAPAHIRKEGASFDLAIAVALLAATGQVPGGSTDGHAVCGELSLGGELRPVRGVLAVALGARAAGLRRLIVAPGNADEAAVVDGVEVAPVPTLARLADLFHGRWRPQPAQAPEPPGRREDALDLADVRGQPDAKRALEIAAAGGHNLLMVGAPGSGKTMLARRLPGILPPPSFEEALEITRIQSVAGLGRGRLVTSRPFRAPHHTVSAQGLVGGGIGPRPGEVTLAHRGVLFLDELPEFSRQALDALRQPVEEGSVVITRAQRSLLFPAAVTVVAACNRCPCARPPDHCSCSTLEVARYQRRLSGPLLDRIDLVCQVEAVPPVQLAGPPDPRGSSEEVRERVEGAREHQQERLAGTAAVCNADMDGRLTRRLVGLRGEGLGRLARPAGRALTGRGHDRVLRVARTIADLAGREAVAVEDVEEALGFRVNADDAVAA